MAQFELHEVVQIGERHVWFYYLGTNLGLVFVVQHEETGFEIVNDYMGQSIEKAEKVFVQTATEIIRKRFEGR